MALLFAVGSACFLVGPFPGYVGVVGPKADAVTFFAGSVFFTAGGALQVWLSLGGPRSALWVAGVQSAGTLFFNVTTFAAMHTALTNPHYDKLVWRPDAFGSICFLVSGAIAYAASPRRGCWPRREEHAWWEPAVNLLGCVFFGISAVAGYVVPASGSTLDLAAANWNTALGAVCFLACALATLRSGHTSKSPRLRRLRRLERTVARDVARLMRASHPHRVTTRPGRRANLCAIP